MIEVEVFYIVTAALFLIYPEASAFSADIACKALKSVVIRSLFPMMVLTRLIAHSKSADFLSRLLSKRRIWKRLNLSDELLPVVLGGLISGIPSSSREIASLLNEGRINGEEAKKALALSSLPSPAFVILVASDGIGEGVMRFLLMLFCAYFGVLCFRSKKSTGGGEVRKMSFTAALSSSTLSALSVSASIVFFSAVTCLVSSVLPHFRQVSAIFFEMGSGVIFADGNGILISAALGWCGLSAMAQIRSEAPDVSLKPHVLSRLMTVATLILAEILQKTDIFS